MSFVIDNKLVCNNTRCQRLLTSTAWISSCSHLFCEEHSPAYETDKKCPLCSSDLNERYDLIKTDLNPSEETKSMMLAGFSPTNILEIGSKALAFWNFQMFQERTYQTSLVKYLRGRLAQTDSSHENIIQKLKALVQQESQKCESLEKELHNYMRREKELEEKVEIKNRELMNFCIQYEALKKQLVSSHRSDHMSLSQHTATGRVREPGGMTLPPTKPQDPLSQASGSSRQQETLSQAPGSTRQRYTLSQAPVFARQRDTLSQAPGSARQRHTLSQAPGSARPRDILSQPTTPQNMMSQVRPLNKRHVFSYQHVPSAPPRSTFNFNPVTNQHLKEATPNRPAQTYQLFSS